MVIDIHGHYTTAPKELTEYRENQKRELEIDPLFEHEKGVINISDEQLKESIVNNQLKLQKKRGTDITVFSPRASRMGHHVGNVKTSQYWTEHCNELIHRIVELFPQSFVGCAQLPQSIGTSINSSAKELERVIKEYNFIACNLNPDPTGGYWNDTPKLDDKYWYPIYEVMHEYGVPAMVHVSGCFNPIFHVTSSYYMSANVTAFSQLMMSKTLFKDFPNLKFIIPHGGGAIPYQWGRFRGLCDMLDLDDLHNIIENNIYFDTCVYDQKGIDLMLDEVPTQNILFASEMIGAVRGVDPLTGHHFDDTKRYIDASKISDEKKQMIFEDNIRKVYPRINQHIEKHFK